jgi:hypothetical protein
VQAWLVTAFVQRAAETAAPSLRVQLVTVRAWVPAPQVLEQAPQSA